MPLAQSDFTPEDAQVLDAAFLPGGPGLEPALVLYPAKELSPGAWRRAEAALEIPESARRLTLPFGDPDAPRFLPTRALDVGEAIRFLLPLAQAEVRPSVRAWALAAHVAQRLGEGLMRPRGDEKTDAALTRLAQALPEAASNVLIETLEHDDMLGPAIQQEGPSLVRTGQQELLRRFLDIAEVARTLQSESSRRAAPRKRAASRELNRLTMRLSMPSRVHSKWRLYVDVAPEATDAAVAASGTVPVRSATPGAIADSIAEVLAAGSQTFPPLQRFGGIPHEDGIEMEAEEASALIIATQDLEARGAGVEFPESLMAGLTGAVTTRIRLGRKAKGKGSGTGSSSRRPSKFRLDDLVSYDVQVALGDQVVDANELRELARTAKGLVQMGERWVALTDTTRDQLEKLARAVESRDAAMATANALSASLSGMATLAGGIVATVDEVDDEELQRVLKHLRQPETFPDVTPVPGFVGELRPYQEDGVRWLCGMASLPLGAVLADDMGLGKTVQMIALFAHLKAQKGSLRAIVVCPTSLIGNWEREISRFAPDLKAVAHHGASRTARPEDLLDADVVVTSYGIIARDREMLSEIEWDVAAFDEAQAVKNPEADQARAVRRIRAGFRVALTGTPMENRLLELWSILDLVNPSLLGTARVFNRRFAAPIERAGPGDEAADAAAATLRAITRPFLLRRVKHDPTIVPDLPEKQERVVECVLTPEQAALYQATVDQAMSDVRSRDGIARRGAVLALLTRLKQVCNHPAQMLGQDGPIEDRSGKLLRLTAMLEEVVAEGDRALVFTQYAQMGHLLAKYLPDALGVPVPFLYGGVPRNQRETMVAKFQAEDAPSQVFVLSLRAGGLGLNLMGASHVFHYDRWWNPAVEDQATDRTHRIGQTRAIQVHKLVCTGTLEERIGSIIDDKRALAGRVIDVAPGAGEGWMTELSDAELEELVSLSAPVGE